MTHVLVAGDHFVLPSLFIDAIKAKSHSHNPTFSELVLPWPLTPFGQIGNVQEASGSIQGTIDALQSAEIAVTQMAPFTAEVFARAPGLKMIGVSRGGPVNIDLKAATEAGVIVSYAPGRNAQAAAEFTIGLMLAAMRRITKGDSELHLGTWRGDFYTYENAGIELAGSTIGLIGYGAIGSIVARVLIAFGAQVVVYDPYANAERLSADGTEQVELSDLLKRSSVVSLHARLTEETRHILNTDNLKLLPKGAVLINSARGGLLDYSSLPHLLRSGALGAVALDVYEIEPPTVDWPLLNMPNVVLAPHLGGATRQTAARAAEIIAGEVDLYLNEKTPQFVANPEVLKRFALTD
jgi:D-3-phosphoglycerate dehydrogenase